MNTSRMKWFNRPPMRDFTINAFLPPGVFPSVTAGESIVSTAPFKNTDDTTSDKKNFGSFHRSKRRRGGVQRRQLELKGVEVGD